MASEQERANQFDEALARQRAGEAPPSVDPDLAALLALARRLERELPEDLPDQAFRARLRDELLAGARPAPAPVHLDQARQERRWRQGHLLRRAAPLGAAIAATLAVAVVAGWGALTSLRSPATPPAPATEAVQAVAPPTATPSAAAAITSLNQPAPSRTAAVAAVPPVDADHVVVAAMGLGGGPVLGGSPVANPTIAWRLADGLSALPPLPATATVYRLTGPDDPRALVEGLKARLGIEGEIREEPGGPGYGPVYVVESGDGRYIRWEGRTAMLMVQATPPRQAPTGTPSAAVDPVQAARRWLERAGFDLASIHYETKATRNPNGSADVFFTPAGLPQAALVPPFGATVNVGPDGTVRSAMGNWVSLTGQAQVTLRSADAVWADVQAGRVYWPLFSKPRTDATVTIERAEVAYVLARADDGELVLEPAVELRGTVDAPPHAQPARVFADAVARP